ncbi:MAG: hypothetical protein JJU36_03620 [Phycisphaeraceae bacterium]|nr:hypothetical protein [Phycisphaeraceae bacterium]
MNPAFSDLECEVRRLISESESLQRAAERIRSHRRPSAARHDSPHAEPYHDFEVPTRAEGYCPVTWMLGDLVSLIASRPEEPVSTFESHIRMRISEQNFCGECGDIADDAHIAQSIDAQVDAVIEVLESIRSRAVASGTLCGREAAIPQCG